MAEFNSRWVAALNESSVMIYSGHSGFWVDGEGLNFYNDMPTEMNQNRYQIAAINGCQSASYFYPIHEAKPRNLDLFVNVRPSVANPAVTSDLVASIVNWARYGEKTTYLELVNGMNQVGALTGVITYE